jgi:hypothetical protein
LKLSFRNNSKKKLKKDDKKEIPDEGIKPMLMRKEKKEKANQFYFRRWNRRKNYKDQNSYMGN